MKSSFFLLILATVVLSISGLPKRVRRQFDWENGFDLNQPTSQQSPGSSPLTPPAPNQNQFTTTTAASPTFTRCTARCMSTPEYNPVCGTDGNTYPNESRLRCAARCGLNVQVARGGTCVGL